jgi:hypothetical protein
MPLAMRIHGGRASLLGVAMTLAIGCGQIIGADAYAVAAPDAAADPGDVALPLLPVRPDPAYERSCEACVEVQCDEERAACRESERCRALLDCHGRCSDPDCVFRCRDTEPESVRFEEYLACAFGDFRGGASYSVSGSRCPYDCNAGANWACAENFRWTAEQPGTIELDVTVRLSEARTSSGALDSWRFATIAGCEEGVVTAGGELVTGDRGCDAGVSFDVEGHARLTLGRRRSAFVLRGGVTDEDRVRIYNRLVPRSGRLDLDAFTFSMWKVWLPPLLASTGHEVDPELGTVMFGNRDCTGGPATARVEVEATADATPVRYYWTSYADPDMAALAWSSGGFSNVPPGADVVLAAYHPVDGRLLARRRVLVAPGWLTQVTLFPAPLP